MKDEIDEEELEEEVTEAEEPVEEPKEKPKEESIRFLLLKINELQKSQSQIEEVMADNQKFIKVHHEQLKRLQDNFKLLLETRK